MEKDKCFNHLIKTFTWLNQLAEKKEKVEKSELEKFFTEDLEIYTNNLPLVGLEKFQQHLQISLSHYAHSKVIFPFRQYLFDDKKVALYYTVRSSTFEEENFEYIVMSIFKFRKEKITSWWEVVAEITKES